MDRGASRRDGGDLRRFDQALEAGFVEDGDVAVVVGDQALGLPDAQQLVDRLAADPGHLGQLLLGERELDARGRGTRRLAVGLGQEQQALGQERGQADRQSGSEGMPRPISNAVFCLQKKNSTEHRV